MLSVALVSFLKIVSLLGSALIAVKLFRSRLYLRYKVFFAFFVFRVPNGTWPFFFDIKSNIYLHFWIVTEPLFWGFSIFLVVELYRLVLEKHKGIYTLGRWFMYLATALSVAISALSMLPKIKPEMPQASKIMGVFFATERGIDFSLAIFILLLLSFLVLFRVPLSRNVKVHSALYSVYFLSNTLGLLVRSIFGKHLMNEVDLFLMAASCGCLIAWLLLLNPSGERLLSSASGVSPGDETRLLLHLDALNRTLLEATGK
jgi:hypothetical protein